MPHANYGLPTEGESNWDDKLNDSIEYVKEVAEEASSNASAAITTANTAIADAAEAIDIANAAGAVTSVAGKTGAVSLVKADVGLGNVDNTSDANKPVSTATQTALDAKANASQLKFILTGNAPGEVLLGDVVEGGIPMPDTIVLDRIMVSVNVEPRGANLVVQAIKRTRSTGNESTLGTLTITANTGKRATLTGLAATFAQDDRLFLRVTQVGSSGAGAGLHYYLADTNTTFPSALAAPSAPGSASAVASGDDVSLTWTAPASGVYHSVDVWRDGSFLARVLKGTNAYTDVTQAANDHTYELRANNNDAVSSTATAPFTAGAALGLNDLGTATLNASGTSIVITTTRGAAVGEDVVVLLAGSVPVGGGAETITASDNKGNTYTTRVHAYNGSATNQTAIIQARVTTALVTSDTITVSLSNAITRGAVRAYVVNGMTATTPFDASNTNVITSGATNNLTTNATAALAQADEIAFAAFSCVSSSLPFTPGSGWNSSAAVSTSAGSNERSLIALWRVTTSTAALTGTCNLSSGSLYAGAIGTFKGA